MLESFVRAFHAFIVSLALRITSPHPEGLPIPIIAYTVGEAVEAEPVAETAELVDGLEPPILVRQVAIDIDVDAIDYALAYNPFADL